MMHPTDKTVPGKSSFWEPENNFSLGITLIFLLLGFIGILRHEMWQDELQAWMTARDSFSLTELSAAVKYQGHPLLWYLLLYPLTRLTHNPLAMQIVHVFIAGAMVWVFARFSPFTRLQKALFIFGFFPLYEYTVISRGYGLGILFLFLFCAFYKERLKKYVLLSLLIFLLAQTSATGLVVAIALQAVLVFEIIVDRQFRQQVSKTGLVFMLTVFFAGVTVCLWQCIPPADSGIATQWYTQLDYFRLERIASQIYLSYFASPYYWSPAVPLWAYEGGLLLKACLAGAIFLYCCLLFLRQPKVLFLYLCGTLGLSAFFYLKYEGYSWHHGHLYILLFVCFWLSAYYPDTSSLAAKSDKLSAFCKKYQGFFISVLLISQLVQGARVYLQDCFHNFSSAKQAAQFIKKQGLEKMPIIGEPDYMASPVCGYLDKKIYYLRGKRFGSYIRWDRRRLAAYDLNKLKDDPLLRDKKCLLVLTGEWEKVPFPMRKIKEFTEEMGTGERYGLYILDLEK
jgi:hypothetical protein